MCMICDDNGQVVVIERKKKNWPGIAFPGGHVEAGESFVDAIIREVYEETGLTIQHPQLCGITDWFVDDRREVVLLYKTNAYTGTLRSSSEGEVRWELFDNLPNLELAYNLSEMIRVFQNDDLSELFYRNKENKWLFEVK